MLYFGNFGGDIKDKRDAHDWNKCVSTRDATDDRKEILDILLCNLVYLVIADETAEEFHIFSEFGLIHIFGENR